MASVIYLDIDDEITSAAARIRAAEAVRIALVLPAGSHLATSRINFRLLAREAQGRSRQLLIVAPDAAARALAASAGLPVYASVRELEAESAAVAADGDWAASEAGEARGASRSPIVVPASSTSPIDEMSSLHDASGLEETQPIATVGPAGGTVGSTAGPSAAAAGAAVASRRAADHTPDRGPMARRLGPADVPVAALPGRGRQTTMAAVLAVVAMVLVVGGVLGYVFLPAATIVVTPRIEAIGPLTFPVRADPEVTSADALAGVVPATVATLPLEESATFPATGTNSNAHDAAYSWKSITP